jgi:hypothetical protein
MQFLSLQMILSRTFLYLEHKASVSLGCIPKWNDWIESRYIFSLLDDTGLFF